MMILGLIMCLAGLLLSRNKHSEKVSELIRLSNESATHEVLVLILATKYHQEIFKHSK